METSHLKLLAQADGYFKKREPLLFSLDNKLLLYNFMCNVFHLAIAGSAVLAMKW